MATTNWKPGTVGSWQDAANWTNGVPAAGDAAILIGAGSSATNTGTITDVSVMLADVGQVAYDAHSLSTFDNQGTMLASAGGTGFGLQWGYIGATQKVYNEGLIAGSPGAAIGFSSYSNPPLNEHYGLLINSGTIDGNGGNVGINADVTQTATGVIEIDNGGTLVVNAIVRGGLLKINSGAVSFGMPGGHGDMGRSVAALQLTSNVEFDGPADLSFIKPITRLDFNPATDTLGVVGDIGGTAGLAYLHLVGTYTADEFAITPDQMHLTFTPTAPVVQNPPPASDPPPASNPPPAGDPPPAAGDPPPPVTNGPPPSTNFTILDTTTNTPSSASGTAYSGPVAGLNWQYLNLSPDSLNITSGVQNAFIHSGAGQDAIDVSHANGNNVLDGDTGSNFLVGGSGSDTFFLDDRNPGAALWSTLVNFHSGDSATVWGLTAADFQIQTLDNQGAAGFTGLTFNFTRPGQPTASLTLTGFTTADLSNGRLAMTSGRTDDQPGLPGSDYLSIRGA